MQQDGGCRMNKVAVAEELVKIAEILSPVSDPLDPIDARAIYTADIGRELLKLRRVFNIVSIRQSYKGTGSQRARRQLWIRLGNGRAVDVWLNNNSYEIGGVLAGIGGPVAYAGSPAEVSKEIAEKLQLLPPDTRFASSRIAMPVFEKAPGFDGAFQEFFAFCFKVYTDYMTQQFPTNPRQTMEFREGGRYVKITQNSGSVFLFVDKANGDILKAATWSAPAKHARGNIFDKASWKNAVTAYGAAYLR